MSKPMQTCVVMPALNEADALPAALAERPGDIRIIVVDNASTDETSTVAEALGVEVLREPVRGFGAACAAGLGASEGADVVVFMDADDTCDWNDLDHLIAPIIDGDVDLVLGRRVKDLRARGAMSFHVSIANALLGSICRRLSGAEIHDVPPYRAVRRTALIGLNLHDRTYGWPLEMILQAARQNLRIAEVPVHYRRRAGTSKVTGTVTGTVKATMRMLRVLWRYR